MMNRVPTNQELADALGIAADDVSTCIVHCRSLPIQGGWVLTFSERTPEKILSKLQLSKTLSCTVVLPEKKRPYWRSI